MIGQEKLLHKLKDFTRDTFSHSVLLLGESGSGKHLIAQHIAADLLKLPLLDISENISEELIGSIYRNPNPQVYLINLGQLTEASQNVLLKFVEEPLNNAFVILLAENTFNVLNTLVNRCMILYMDPYTPEELQMFMPRGADRALVLKVAHTPGQLKNLNVNTLEDMQNVCSKIATRLSQANFANTLSISNKINFKDEYDKFDLRAFLMLLSDTLYECYLGENNSEVYKLYELTQQHQQRLRDSRLNKEHFVNHFLTCLWKASRGLT